MTNETKTIHLTHGGSSATRTLQCPAWALLSEQLPPLPSTEAASLGTALHSILEAVLKDRDCDPIEFVGTEIEGVTITLDHIQQKIDPAIDAFDALMSEHDLVDFWAEIFATLPGYDDVGGTADIVALSADGTRLMIADYKTGDGYLVDAENNDQLMFYAMCVLRDQSFRPYVENCKEIILAIIQPTDRRDYVVSQVTVPFEAVNETFYTQYTQALSAQNVEQQNAGAHCKFCPAHAICPAKKALAESVQSLRPVDEMIADDLGDALIMANELSQWIKAVQRYAYERLEAGAPVTGWKLVESNRGHRRWTDERAVEAKIKTMRHVKISQARSYSLKSPAQMEKVFADCGQDFSELASFIQKGSSRKTMARDSDARPEVASLTTSLAAIANRNTKHEIVKTEKEKQS